MDKLFKKVEEFYKNQQDQKDSLKDELQAWDQSLSVLTTKFQQIHHRGFDAEKGKKELNKVIEEQTEEMKKSLEGLSKKMGVMGKGAYYKFGSMFSRRWSQIVCIFCVNHYLNHEKDSLMLVSKESIEKALDISKYEHLKFPLDDYLYGVCNFCSEIVRFSKNCVTRGNYEEPGKISDFLNDLYNGFKMLNLKNDGLRKRFDGLKYDMKNLENVVYDLSIRGLIEK